jgi:hypothetical protein
VKRNRLQGKQRGEKANKKFKLTRAKDIYRLGRELLGEVCFISGAPLSQQEIPFKETQQVDFLERIFL